jgi:hypothetical protein
MGHSGSSQIAVLPAAQCPASFDPTGFAGFGYLLGPPGPGQQSQLGADPANARRLLATLSRALPVGNGYWSAPLRPDAEADDNPGIPSGYTYLLQLVAHDTVQSSLPFWAAAGLGLASRNLRAAPMLLDTLYGGGPNAAAVAYSARGNSTADRTLLRVGRFLSMKTGKAPRPDECPFRDLARINLWASDQVQAANFDDPFITCVADTRNDDNLVLAQLVALFASVHNLLAGRLDCARPEAVFGYAQVATRRLYHAIVERDLLPRLLHPAIMAALTGRSADDGRWLWQGPAVPLEFTHGAFRVGHAMVRRQYRFNAIPEAGSLSIDMAMNGGTYRAETRLPLRETWLVDWSQFFDLAPGGGPNLSRRLAPTQSALDAPSLFKSNDVEQPETLSLRDMLSAALARTWHVDAALERIVAHGGYALPPAWPWNDQGRRRESIRGWLATRCRTGVLAATDIDALAADPPLPLFVLLEAALDPEIDGRHLGPLGSIIIGEVIGRSIALARQGDRASEEAAKAAFGASFWDEMGDVVSMPSLIEFARRNAA